MFIESNIHTSGEKSTNKPKKFIKLEKTLKSKNLSKSKKLHKFDAQDVRSTFLILDARIDFNQLWLVFIKALIFQHFDTKYHI